MLLCMYCPCMYCPCMCQSGQHGVKKIHKKTHRKTVWEWQTMCRLKPPGDTQTLGGNLPDAKFGPNGRPLALPVTSSGPPCVRAEVDAATRGWRVHPGRTRNGAVFRAGPFSSPVPGLVVGGGTRRDPICSLMGMELEARRGSTRHGSSGGAARHRSSVLCGRS